MGTFKRCLSLLCFLNSANSFAMQQEIGPMSPKGPKAQLLLQPGWRTSSDQLKSVLALPEQQPPVAGQQPAISPRPPALSPLSPRSLGDSINAAGAIVLSPSTPRSTEEYEAPVALPQQHAVCSKLIIPLGMVIAQRLNSEIMPVSTPRTVARTSLAKLLEEHGGKGEVTDLQEALQAIQRANANAKDSPREGQLNELLQWATELDDMALEKLKAIEKIRNETLILRKKLAAEGAKLPSEKVSSARTLPVPRGKKPKGYLPKTSSSLVTPVISKLQLSE